MSSHVMPEYFLSRFAGNDARAFFGSPDHFAESDDQARQHHRVDGPTPPVQNHQEAGYDPGLAGEEPYSQR